MLTKQEWWDNMSQVNGLLFPWQFVMLFIAALLVLFVVFKPGKISSVFMKLYFVLGFLWIGIGFSGINNENYVGAVLFSAIALFFAIDIYKQKLIFRFPKKKSAQLYTVFFLLLIFSYPLVGLLLGHASSEIFMIGTYPCPTTSLGLVMITMALPRINKILYALLLFWAMFSIPAILIYAVFEDLILMLSGVYAALFLYKNRKVLVL
ncbi:MAG: hypothetical protein B7C24_05155 [Bacteroidetes bacterium 4572_77]|nr:MAG: hypothetical protein B7C24_05155 [Bacteroidetes bacterium 4572_77]